MPPTFHATPASAVAEIGIGLLGYRFMGKAHSNAYQRLPLFFPAPAARPRQVAICGRNEAALAEAAHRYGWEGYYTDWRALLDDPRIALFDNCASADNHAEPTIAAAQAGKHLWCEKPLALYAADALRMWRAAEQAGVVHMVGFNYRFVPAVRHLRDLIASGRLGRIYQPAGALSARGRRRPRASFHLAARPRRGRLWRAGRPGRAHHRPGALFGGEIAAVSAMTATFVAERPLADRPASGAR